MLMDHSILYEQLAYYRARAQEYDESTRETAELKGVFARARDLLQQRGPYEQVLELACGTGTWTQVLLAIGLEITAIDAAPEMLEMARQKLRNTRVHYQQPDLFQWEPEREYHLVFFANWLSHVPPEELDTFLSRVARAVRPGGYVAIIDQYAPTPEDRQIMKKGEGGNIYAQRPLLSGKTFTIIKIFYDVMALQEIFTALGFEAMSYQLNDSFFFFEARRY
jgi:trans-aconitate methyltransferase